MPIRILDAATVGRIAAGEVVERPASVVKELMENALDAGATAITVEIRGGGIDYLRVTDNGCGIEPGQVRLAFENHATSKLQSADQLDDIRTLGFRGEALPSIAAVSHVEMTTRTREHDTGMRLKADGGANMDVREAGCPQGTTIVMRDLFYNVPVRRAFLKKAPYEGGLVRDTVARLAIGNPNVSVRFIANGATAFHSYGDGKLRHAVFAVYGKETAEKMVEVDAFEGGTRIRGLIGVGDLARPTREHELFFINGRLVRCALLTKALEQVSRSRVTIGLYPMCALALTLPPQSIDVNVHPNKLEVRFRDEEATRAAVERLLGSAFEGERVLDLARDARPAPQVERVSTVTPRATVAPRPQPIPERPQPIPERPQPAAVRPQMPPLPGVTPPEAPARPPAIKGAQVGMFDERPASRLREDSGALPGRPVVTVDGPAPDLAGSAVEQAAGYRLIGVAFNTYIILEVGDALLLIDQHAAHERLRYEKYCRDLEAGAASQRLLTPLVLRLSAREMALIRDNLNALSDAGYEVEPFGETDIRVTAVPHVLGRAELRPIFLDMLGSLGWLRAATLDERRAEIMQMSCKSAVKGGDALTESEIRTLLDDMRATDAPPTCPHGRPVVRTVQKRELDKFFKRIQ